MTTSKLLLSTWEWHPSVVAGCIALLALYAIAVRPRSARAAMCFAGGVLIVLVALVSPLDALGDTYLFSAHMLQHLLLVLFAPPLLVCGIPRAVVGRLLAHRPIDRIERALARPITAWLLGIGTLWMWHLPVLYNATLASETIHIAEHLSFIVTGVIFWWPVFTRDPARAMTPARALFYLLLAAFANTILGVLLTFAPVGLYPAYLHPADPLGALPLIRRAWALSPQADQELGGVFMWVIGGLAFLGAMMWPLRRLFQGPEPVAPGGRPAPPRTIGWNGARTG